MIKTILIILILIHLADTFVTAAYSIVSKRFYAKAKASFSAGKSDGINGESSTALLKRVYGFYSGWVRYKLRRLGGVPCHFYRMFMLRYVYQMQIASSAVIYGGFEIRSPWNISIGEGSVIGDECKLDGRNGIEIGKNVQFSTGVWVWTEQHDMNDPYFNNNDKGGKVIIQDRAWVSSRVSVLPKVQIGEGAVIAAGAIVTKNCENYGVYGGVPAKMIGKRSEDLRYQFSGKHQPFY